jgi:MFS family permease
MTSLPTPSEDIHSAHAPQFPDVKPRRNSLWLASILLYVLAALVVMLGMIGGVFFAVTPSIVIDHIGTEYVVTRGAPMFTQGAMAFGAGVVGGGLLVAAARELYLRAGKPHHPQP